MYRLLVLCKITRLRNAVFCCLRIPFGVFRIGRQFVRRTDIGYVTDGYQDWHALQYYFFPVSSSLFSPPPPSFFLLFPF